MIIYGGELVASGSSTVIPVTGFAVTGSNTFQGNQTINGDITVTGSLTAQQFIVSSSVTYMTTSFASGSTKFGNSLDDTHQFTGSMLLTGSLTVVTNGNEFQVNSGGVNIGNALTDNHVISGSVRINPNGLFVSSSGNLGIGTNIPSQKLHISDSTSVYTRIVNTAGADLYLGSESTQGVLAVNNNYPLDIRTNNTTRLFINAAGNVGLGITPSTGWTSFTTLQLGGNTYSALASSNHYLNIAANSYYDGTNFRYISNGYTSRYQLSDSTHLWYVGASGATGNVVSYSTAMTITSGGNLLVGTSTNQGEKVYVDGGVRATGGMYASLFEGEFGQVLSSVSYGGTTISKNLAELDPGAYLIHAYMMRGGDGVNTTYSVLWYYMHLSGFGGGSDYITALYSNPGPQNNNGRIALTGAGYTVEITWGGARGPAAVTALKLRDGY